MIKDDDRRKLNFCYVVGNLLDIVLCMKILKLFYFFLFDKYFVCKILCYLLVRKYYIFVIKFLINFIFNFLMYVKRIYVNIKFKLCF